MKIDRDAELFGCLPKRPILLLVQVLAVRLPVHHGSTKSEFGHAAPELGDGGLSILKWESGKPGKAVGMFLNPLGKNVDLVHPSLLLVGLMSFPPQADEQRPLQRAQQKLFPLKPHEQRGRRHAAYARPKRKIAEKLGPGTLDVA